VTRRREPPAFTGGPPTLRRLSRARYFTSSDTGWLQSSAPVFVTAR
jgi:hypothetical protein